MILEGFKIKADGISFEVSGRGLDLHNDYDFANFSYRVAEKSLCLVWELSRDNQSKHLPEVLYLFLLTVYLFRVREPRRSASPSEDACLDSVGFMWNDLADEFEGYAKHVPSAECSHLNLNFQSDFAIKVGAAKAIFRTNEDALDLEKLAAFRATLGVQVEKSAIVEMRQEEHG